MAIKINANGYNKPFFCDTIQLENQKPHKNIWVNILCEYCGCLDLSINNIITQPHVLMNAMKNRLEEN
jgi:hypothetical protein